MISAVILTKNEEKYIEDCIKSVSWCDEIIVIDDNSVDDTINRARRKGALLFEHSLKNNFSEQRNFGLEKSKSEWVLFIDADERVTEDLKKEIQDVLKDTKHDGFTIQRIDYVWGKRLNHGETGNIHLLRLARKGKGKWDGQVHEEWIIKGSIGKLKNYIEHYPFESLSEFLTKINHYTTIRAQELFEQKVDSNFLSIIFYTKGKFFLNYFTKLGFLDGIPGLIHALCMSFHSFLVRSKLWLLWNKK